MKVKKIIMPEAIIPMIILIVVWILLDGKNMVLELKITGLLLLGGYELEILLRMLFHHLGPMNIESSSIARYTFPDEHVFIAVVVYGFILFLFVRDSNIKWVNSLFFIAVAAACFLIGLSELYLGFAYPSDIAAGYVLGGFWLCLNIVLLEIFRVLPDIDG